MTLNFIGIQGSYKHLEVALFVNDECVSIQPCLLGNTSAQFIPFLSSILANHKLQLVDIHFIAADHGPGAFTSLRTTLATLNGIGAASGIPLIGIDGLDALAQATQEASLVFNTSIVAPLLNAFNNEVYFGVYAAQPSGPISPIETKGYQQTGALLSNLKLKYPKQKFLFCGNGATLNQDAIAHHFGDMAAILSTPEVAPAEQVARQGRRCFTQQTNLTKKLLPRYLKTQQFQVKYQ